MKVEGERFLVTGANGQDGTYLVESLLAQGGEVIGMCHSAAGAARLRDAQPSAIAVVADLSSDADIRALVQDFEPTRIFNLAGNTSVARSWEFPAATADVLGVGPVRLFDAAWKLFELTGREVRILQASSAEIFGNAIEVQQRETTPRQPVTPYGAAKSFAHEMVAVYRRRGMFASTAILYNHESPRRPPSFVARKISLETARIALGMSDRVVLGNIDVSRDWGYAPDFVDGMMRILDAPDPDDFIVATGVAHSVREFVACAFSYVGITDWEKHVEIDASLYRPADPQRLVGDASKLRSLGWEPTLSFEQLVNAMVEADLAELSGAEQVSHRGQTWIL